MPLGGWLGLWVIRGNGLGGVSCGVNLDFVVRITMSVCQWVTRGFDCIFLLSISKAKILHKSPRYSYTKNFAGDFIIFDASQKLIHYVKVELEETAVIGGASATSKHIQRRHNLNGVV